MNVAVFEDGRHDNFYPFSLVRPLWDLRSGLYTQKERIERALHARSIRPDGGIHYFTRDYLAPAFREKYPRSRINDYSVFERGGDTLFINAVKYPAAADFALERNSAVVRGTVPVSARLDSAGLATHGDSVAEKIMGRPVASREYREEPEGGSFDAMPEFIWNMVSWNGDIIKSDFRLSGLRGNGGENDVTILGDPGLVFIDEGVTIDPMVLIDATGGPVVILSGSIINSFTRIEGPAVIGRNCLILGAKIRAGVSLGDVCRIGGEVEESIFHGYDNKYHDGFIGHSYIGEWVNMGAMTSNSDLKNDYTPVKVYTPNSRKKTGLKKIGCFMGDFVKTSIGTLINTGTSIGTGAMLVHAGQLTPYHIPPFCRYMYSEIGPPQNPDEFIETCRQAMSRRNIDITGNFITLINTVYRNTTTEKK